MSSNVNYKQVANVTRRTWDTETYTKKAQDRLVLEQGRDSTNNKSVSDMKRKQGHATSYSNDNTATALPSTEDCKLEFQPAILGSIGPEGSDRAYLKARRNRVTDIDSRIGQTELVGPDAAATVTSKAGGDNNRDDGGVVQKGIGWHCTVCDCFLKDSHTYLDHINGRKHQRKLGYTMRVERSTKDHLLEKLKELTKAKMEKEKRAEEEDEYPLGDRTYYEERVKAKDEVERRRKEERRKKRQECKKRHNNQQDDTVLDCNVRDEEGTANGGESEHDTHVDHDDMAAIMGFSGFSGRN